MEQHFVYIIRSTSDSTFYKGYSTDYTKRLAEHNAGMSRYTSTKGPWVLVYVEQHLTKRDALIRERKLKRCNSDYIRWLISQPSNIIASDEHTG